MTRISLFKRIKETSRSKRFTWVLFCFILFIWQFSYWGDHGLGDYSRVPIGYGKEIEQINSTGMYISPNGYESQMFGIKEYSIDKEYCFGSMSKNKGFFIWNLKTNGIQKISTYEKYMDELKSKRIQDKYVFHNFQEAYDSYWSGWRFWLLP
ncbi:MAG: hypothetical protein Crog4KO_30300 [Crocinitomicaceae bacterium]